MLSTLADTLVENRRLQSQVAVAAYERAVLALREQPRDVVVLPRLLSAFCDAEDYGMTWTLLNYVESFEGADYVAALVNATPVLLVDARCWLDTLYTRILNADADLLALKAALVIASPEQQRAVWQVFDGILDDADSARRSDFSAKIAAVTSTL